MADKDKPWHPPATKICNMCNEEKSRCAFPSDSSRRDGLAYRCKKCCKKLNTDGYHRRRETDPEGERERSRFSCIRRKYGLGKARFLRMMANQHGQCAICSVDIDLSCHVDHCHDSGKVRGLLCGSCNTGIGFLQDSPDVILNAFDYLMEHVDE